MTDYEIAYIKHLHRLLNCGFESWDGILTVPSIVMEIDAGKSFPILALQDMDFQDIINNVNFGSSRTEVYSKTMFHMIWNGIKSTWCNLGGYLNCSIMLDNFNYVTELPSEVVAYAAKMYSVAEQKYAKPGNLNIYMAAPYVRAEDFQCIATYLDRACYSSYGKRMPINPYYSRIKCNPKLTIINSRFVLQDYPDNFS